ncbi:hypothetical protein SISNIDRAFT_486200 [Sistotremastrum niveocremeum HHB9708]|uniref:F-box domain-containing protein n=1 Tax=Sistotremastrum niveocremeum HHB9708 TaxID=1314777 RepID=A0A164TW00_9AGAM|nr:hypothetical protein SISNIDRAFT_486200 [Sistotremastrum niveocremeum HHB9708]
MAHQTCSNLLCKVFGVPSSIASLTKQQLRTMCEIETVLGRCTPAARGGVGRVPYVNYESVTGLDMRSYWGQPRMPGHVAFDWKKFKDWGPTWVLARPDVFPKFFSKVTPERLASVGEPSETFDILTTQPLDILQLLIEYLDIPGYLALTSTCRTLRKLALTSFQPRARKYVLSIPWATPLLDSSPPEYVGKNDVMAHPQNSPHDADWLLYLSHVHRTNSMKERRRVWLIVEEIKRAYETRRETMYSRPEWPAMSRELDGLIDSALQMSRDLTSADERSKRQRQRAREEQIARETALD